MDNDDKTNLRSSNWNDDLIKRLEDYMKTNLSFGEIAEELGVSRTEVSEKVCDLKLSRTQ